MTARAIGRVIAVIALVAAAGGLKAAPPSQSQPSHVIVTVPRANVREAPTTDSRVVTQVTSGTTIELVATEGDWYKVRLAMGGIRIEAYLAKSVAKPAEGPAGAAAGGGAGTAAPAVSKDGMSVAWQSGESSSWITPQPTSMAIVPGRSGSLSSLAKELPAPGAEPPRGGAPVMFVWMLPASAAGPDITDRRPTFVVQVDGVPGVAATRLTAELVELVPGAGGELLIGAVPGRADQAIWGDPDWDVMRTIVRSETRTSSERLAAGAIQLRPSSDLAPGSYAIVVRPATRDRMAGADVLKGQREGIVFAVAWPFRVK
jgi:hypothetical protein